MNVRQRFKKMLSKSMIVTLLIALAIPATSGMGQQSQVDQEDMTRKQKLKAYKCAKYRAQIPTAWLKNHPIKECQVTDHESAENDKVSGMAITTYRPYTKDALEDSVSKDDTIHNTNEVNLSAQQKNTANIEKEQPAKVKNEKEETLAQVDTKAQEDTYQPTSEPEVTPIPQPTITDKQPTITDKQPTLTDKQPTITDKQPALTEKQPAITDKQPALTEKQPALTEKQPALTEKQPALTEKQPAKKKITEPINVFLSNIKIPLLHTILWKNAVVASIAHAIMIPHFPYSANEIGWDGPNYLLQDNQGIRGTITFHKDKAVAAFRNDHAPTRSIDTTRFFEQAPAEIKQIASDETLQYLLVDIDGTVQPSISTAFWIADDSLYAIDELLVMKDLGASLLFNQIQDIDHTDKLANDYTYWSEYWSEYYGMNEAQIELFTRLSERKLAHPLDTITLTQADIEAIGVPKNAEKEAITLIETSIRQIHMLSR